MMGNKSLMAVDRWSSVLDRASPISNQPLTEAQALTDQLVSVSIQEGTNLKTAAAMLGAGWVGRFTRIGAMTSLPGQAFATGASYAPALAAESAAFAGIERGFHPSSQPFQKDWARAAATLTPLKLFGGLTRTQNIVVQHLFTDLGLVAGQHGAFAAGLTEKPQGNLEQQMLKAEATNWHMKGSLAFAHAFSPRLSAAEKSLEIFLKSQETGVFSKGQSSPFFSQLAMNASGGRGSISVSPEDPNVWKMAAKKDEGGGGSGGEKGSGKFGEIRKGRLVPSSGMRLEFLETDPSPKKGEGAGEESSSGFSDPKEWKRLVDSARAGNEDARKALSELDVSQLRLDAENVPESIPALLEVVKDFNFQLKILVKSFETPENIREVNEAAQKGNKKATVLLFVLEIARKKVEAGYDPALTNESFFSEVYEKMPEARDLLAPVLWGPALAMATIHKAAGFSPILMMSSTEGGESGGSGERPVGSPQQPLVKKGMEASVFHTFSRKFVGDIIQGLIQQGYRVTRNFRLDQEAQLKAYVGELKAQGVDYRTVTRLDPEFSGLSIDGTTVLVKSEITATSPVGPSSPLPPHSLDIAAPRMMRPEKPLPKALQDVISEGYTVTKVFTELNREEFVKYTKSLDKKGTNYRAVKIHEGGDHLANAHFIYYVLEKAEGGSGESGGSGEGPSGSSPSGGGWKPGRGFGARSLAGVKGFFGREEGGLGEETFGSQKELLGIDYRAISPGGLGISFLPGSGGRLSPGRPDVLPSKPWSELSFRDQLRFFTTRISMGITAALVRSPLEGTPHWNLIYKKAVEKVSVDDGKPVTERSFLAEVNRKLPKGRKLTLEQLRSYLVETVYGREESGF